MLHLPPAGLINTWKKDFKANLDDMDHRTNQMICNDVSHWLLYVILRRDRSHRLIAYPEFPLCALPGDDVAFR